MIYVSSSCVKAKTIREAVEKLNAWGYFHIELSGGTIPYPDLEQDLLELRAKGNTFLCHNYFPPPEKAFVVNLASLDDNTYKHSLEHLKKAVRLSKLIGAEAFGFHAGFLINIPIHEMGKSIQNSALFDFSKAQEQFCKGFEILREEAGSLKLYLENNVLSTENLNNFKQQNPFFLTNFSEYLDWKALIDFKLLLDVAHLKVSTTALALDFEEELKKCLTVSDYIHISDNDGFSDSNKALKPHSELYNLLKKYGLKDKTITLEVYEGQEALETSYLCLQELTK